MPAGLSEVDMQTYVDGLDRFLSDHHNEVVIALALLVLAEAAIIWLWARRAAILRRRLDAAGEAADSAATHAAAALAVDAFRPAEREHEAAAAQPVFHTPAASTPDPAPYTPTTPVPAPQPALSPAPAAAPQPARYTPPAPAPQPALSAPPAPATVPQPARYSPPAPASQPAASTPPAPAAAPQPAASTPPAPAAAPQPARYTPPTPQPAARAAPDLYAAPTASVSPVETAAALRAAAASQPQPTTTGVAAWAVDAAAQLPPATVEERLAALGNVAAWTETPPLASASAAWTWTTPEGAPAGGLEPAAAPAAAITLLLVEDDVNVAKLYRMLLESRGYTVRHAADGVEGLDAARRERPDLILLDVMMPRMNGISFLQALREDPALGTVPAVVLSNFREPRLVERAMALGALEYMVKAQTRPETLIGAIPHWLKGERVVTA
ncbi:MAG TPA: response regulator [Candidatus Dormibacteraeota bacterium]|nr:response regulator [Candidatus Dormibacteraeota bacterium]